MLIYAYRLSILKRPGLFSMHLYVNRYAQSLSANPTAVEECLLTDLSVLTVKFWDFFE